MTAFYHSVQNLLSSKLMLKTINTIYAALQFCLLLCTAVKLGPRGGSNKRLKTLQMGSFCCADRTLLVTELRGMAKGRYVARLAVRCIQGVGEKA